VYRIGDETLEGANSHRKPAMQPAVLPRVKRTHCHEKTKNPPLSEGLKRGEWTRSIAG
jgi:hypothetical protein